MTTLTMVASSRPEYHAVAKWLYEQLRRQGGAWRIAATSEGKERRHQLRKLFNGPMLLDFAEQGAGGKWTKAAWKAMLCEMFIQPRFDDYTNELLRPSSEGLSDDDMSLLILQCAAFGVMECGINFTEEDPCPSP